MTDNEKMINIAKQVGVSPTASGFKSFVKWYKENIDNDLDVMLQDVKNNKIGKESCCGCESIYFNNNKELACFDVKTGERVDSSVVYGITKTYDVYWFFDGKKYGGTMTVIMDGDYSSVSLVSNMQNQTFDMFKGSEEECRNIVDDVKALNFDITDFEIV